jgi:hypothetical protein
MGNAENAERQARQQHDQPDANSPGYLADACV